MASFSVVVPTRDTAALTLRCLQALMPELPPDGEVVVVDDGSTDDSAAAIAAAHPAVRILRLAPALGFTGAANAGLAAATGAIVWLLNSDTEVMPGAVAALRDAFARAPRLGAAGALLLARDGSPQWSGGRAPHRCWLFALASGLAAVAGRIPGYRRWRPVSGHEAGRVDWVPGTALAIRAAAWRSVGPFDEAFGMYAQDVDLCLRLRAAGWDVALVPAARVVHVGGATIGRLEGATTSGQDVARLWADLVRMVAKHEGAAAAADAARALRLGAALRIAGRRAALPFVARARRAAWRRDTAIYLNAVAALR